MDNVELEFDEKALVAIAKEALRRNTGARGLRSIIESVLLNVMYELPSRTDVSKCQITEDTIVRKLPPNLYNKNGELIYSRKEESA